MVFREGFGTGEPETNYAAFDLPGLESDVVERGGVIENIVPKGVLDRITEILKVGETSGESVRGDDYNELVALQKIEKGKLAEWLRQQK